MGLQLFIDVDFQYVPLSFDSFASAMLLLFVSSTGDAWTDVMWSAMDATSPGQPPERNDSSAASLYFIAWMYMGQFVMVRSRTRCCTIVHFRLRCPWCGWDTV